MRIARIAQNGRSGLMLGSDGSSHVLFYDEHDLRSLDDILAAGPDEFASLAATFAQHGRAVGETDVQFLPPLARPGKIVCVGLNYVNHAAEAGFEVPPFPTLFVRFASSLIGHREPIVKPAASDALDFEGELVAIIGRRGRNIDEAHALDHVIGYSVFNDASVRDYQMKTTQWTAGKNFDGTGAFGPWIVTADDLPAGATGLKLETRLNGDVVQSASTADMIFPVARLVAILSSFMTLEAGDIIVTGTPAGIGMTRNPPLYMRPGDVCEVEIEGVGLLANHIAAE